MRPNAFCAYGDANRGDDVRNVYGARSAVGDANYADGVNYDAVGDARHAMHPRLTSLCALALAATRGN